MTTSPSRERARAALHDVSIVIPVRIDTPDRLRNLDVALAWLGRTCEGQETIVLEHGPEAAAGGVVRGHGGEHVFLDSDGCFHKSGVFNLGTAMASRPLVLLYDCDVLVPVEAIEEAIEKLRRDEADYVYPYNGVMLEVACDDDDPRAILESTSAWAAVACSGTSLEDLPDGASYLNGTTTEPSTGGALACKRRTLLLHGGFNPNIASYGCEDTELETRVRKLGARVARLPGYNCFHLRHRRGPDSRYNELHAANLAEWKKVEAMSGAEVARYVRNGFRRLTLDASTRIEQVDTPDAFAVSVVAARARPKADAAFILLMPADPVLAPSLVTAFLDRLESALGGYEVSLVERDGYRYRSVSHRDHVVYASVSSESDYDLLRRLATESERTRICVCSVFLDAGADAVAAALAGGATRAVELAATEAPRDADPRSKRILDLLRTRVGRDARAFVFERAALVEWLEGTGRGSAEGRWYEIANAAHAALGRHGA